MLKVVKGTEHILFEGKLVKLIAALSSEAMKVTRKWGDIFNRIKERNLKGSISSIPFRYEEKLKHLKKIKIEKPYQWQTHATKDMKANFIELNERTLESN